MSEEKRLTIKDFEEASAEWKIPEKHDEGDEVQYFSVETDDPQALDDFLRLFGTILVEPDGQPPDPNSYLVRDGDSFLEVDGSFVIHTKTNGPYIYQMVMREMPSCRNIMLLEVKDG